MGILTAAKGDLVLVEDPEQGLNGMFLVVAADATLKTIDIYPVEQPGSLRAAKLGQPMADWPKTVAFGSIAAKYVSDDIGF